MKQIDRLARLLLPQRAYLGRRLGQIEALYTPLIAAATGQRREDLIREHQGERDLIISDLDALETNHWLQQATKYHVPTPRLTARGDHWEDEYWQRNLTTERWSLNAEGIAKIREGIHIEQKWRRERWTAWIPLVTALVTATAALAGVVLGKILSAK
jgi:hypothetical protein